MKTTLLALLTLGVLVTGCNEKVSPDLDTGAATSDTAIAPSEYVFEVVNTSPVLLNYKLHRTGPARGSSACKVSRMTNPLTNTQYAGESTVAHDLKNYDITCFFEAEELSLFFSGIDFSVKATQNTCDYIGYSPFSYFNYQPGDSTTSLTRVNCTGAPDPTTSPLVPSDGGGKLNCAEVLDSNVTTPTRSDDFEDDQEYCKYDYSASEGPNCDSGRISISEINCTALTVAPFTTTCVSGGITKINCGGSAVACVDGPIKKVSSLSSYTTGTEITEAPINQPMEITYSLDGGIQEQRSANFHIANYRRDLANPNVDYVDRADLGYKAAFTPFLRNFDPLLMESYARNQPYGATGVMIPAAASLVAQKGGNIFTTPMAADPFMGTNGPRVNPFYTFYCFDRAFDIKAKIRMVVRDWDRVFSTDTTELEKLTDIVLAEPRQDNGGEEIIADPGNYNAFNDKFDWDDVIPMERTPLGVSPATIWEPLIVAPLTGPGFYNPDIFPRE